LQNVNVNDIGLTSQETAMALRNNIRVLALRITVRTAWGMARAARAIGGAGEALEGAVDRHAAKHQVDITDVLEPVVACYSADAD